MTDPPWDPLCDDCAYPDDCLCNKRGYHYDDLEVCRARQAARQMRALGIPPEPVMFDGKTPPDTE